MTVELLIEATDQLTTFDGVPVRVWKGLTMNGVECLVLVAHVAVRGRAERAAYMGEITEQLPPARHVPLFEVLK